MYFELFIFLDAKNEILKLLLNLVTEITIKGILLTINYNQTKHKF